MTERRTITLPPLSKDQRGYLEDIKRRSKPLSEKELRNILVPGPNFDADLSPNNLQNRTAARVRKWTYDHTVEKYRDADGALIADKFGQLF